MEQDTRIYVHLNTFMTKHTVFTAQLFFILIRGHVRSEVPHYIQQNIHVRNKIDDCLIE